MNLTAIFVVFIMFGLPIIGVFVLIALKMTRGGSSVRDRKAMEEETRTIQEIYRGMSRMEERVEALETIILSRDRKERG